MGLLVDLTFTDRYYDESEVKDMECAYIRIACGGKGSLPTQYNTDIFVNTCSKYIEENPSKKIGKLYYLF